MTHNGVLKKILEYINLFAKMLIFLRKQYTIDDSVKC